MKQFKWIPKKPNESFDEFIASCNEESKDIVSPTHYEIIAEPPSAWTDLSYIKRIKGMLVWYDAERTQPHQTHMKINHARKIGLIEAGMPMREIRNINANRKN